MASIIRHILLEEHDLHAVTEIIGELARASAHCRCSWNVLEGYPTDQTMKKAAPKKKAPVQLTAEGFRNENCIGARFLLDLLRDQHARRGFSAKSIACNAGRDLGWLQTILSLSARLLQASAPPAFRSKRPASTSSASLLISLAQHGARSASRRSVSFAAATTCCPYGRKSCA